MLHFNTNTAGVERGTETPVCKGKFSSKINVLWFPNILPFSPFFPISDRDHRSMPPFLTLLTLLTCPTAIKLSGSYPLRSTFLLSRCLDTFIFPLPSRYFSLIPLSLCSIALALPSSHSLRCFFLSSRSHFYTFFVLEC